MPKGQVTDEELATSLRGIGGLGALSRTKRDSPFRDSRDDLPKAIDLSAVAEEAPAPARVSELKQAPALPTVLTPERPPPEKPNRSEKRRTAAREAELYTERVTLPMSPEMRDEVDSLARELQRAKTSKDERITANTVMRTAVRLVVEHFKPDSREVANSEEELYGIVARRLKLK